MQPTTITTHSRFTISRVDPRIFGGFLEHLGRAVYEGVYDPGSAHADENGFRRDVLEALDGLSMTAMRYPGGNFASGYHWRDGVGPERPAVFEMAWRSIEPNTFGTDEFLRLCRRMNWTPMLTVNLGTGTPEEARDWVEYCNGPAGTRFADQRVANGTAEPWGVKLWCLGNEMDGAWQLGHVPADQYAIRAQQAAKMMRDTDRSIELVACGSCSVGLPTYLEWDRVVLEHVGDLADYLSVHRYVGNREDDTADYLAVMNAVDRQIEETDAMCRYVAGRRRSNRRAYLAFDEWNVWYKNMQTDGGMQRAPHLVEEVYNLEDALVVAGFLNSFIRHADAVKIANLAQIVNVIAPILTRGDELLIQSTYWAFAMIRRRGEGTALRTAIDGPTYEAKTHGTTHIVDHSVVLDGQRLSAFLVNRSTDKAAPVTLECTDRAVAKVVDAEVLTGPDARAHNDWDAPERIKPQPFEGVAIEGGRAELTLPPLSLVAVTAELAE